jgi:hypothetical protein
MKPAGGLGEVKASPALALGILICLGLVVGMGVWPTPFIDAALAASTHFFG